MFDRNSHDASSHTKLLWKEELNKIEKVFFEDDWKFRSKDIALYGAGKLGELAYEVLTKVEIMPSYFVDVNRKGLINEIEIIRPENINEFDKENRLFVICISTISYEEVKKVMKSIGVVNYIHFYTYAYLMCPHILNNGWIFENGDFSVRKSNIILDLLCDEKSKAHYLEFLWWKKANIEKIYPSFDIEQEKRFFESDLFLGVLNSNERYLDIGSYSGKLIKQFLNVTQGNFAKILAIEPDKDSFEKLSNISDGKIEVKRACVGSRREKDVHFRGGMGYASQIGLDGEELIDIITLSDLNFEASVIKIHTEGSEMAILEGGMDYLVKNRPIIMVLADHSIDGYYNIPRIINKNILNYNIFFRLHDYCGNTAVYYFIPKER